MQFSVTLAIVGTKQAQRCVEHFLRLNPHNCCFNLLFFLLFFLDSCSFVSYL